MSAHPYPNDKCSPSGEDALPIIEVSNIQFFPNEVVDTIPFFAPRFPDIVRYPDYTDIVPPVDVSVHFDVSNILLWKSS
jgi:hypothetical protein